MRNIIQYIKDITRPLRTYIFKCLMTENERKALSNSHLVDDLQNRKLNYKVSKEEILQKKKHVIYTCITGGYDNLIQQTYYNKDYNYVCFTDNENWINQGVIGHWEIKPLAEKQYNNTLNNRWHKTHPYDLFPDYEDSIYIDGNIDILQESFFCRIKDKNSADLLIPIHYARNCIYKEIPKLKWYKKISKNNAKKIKQFLKKEAFPKNYGLNENNLIYRKHSSLKSKKIMEEWWNLILNLVPRDQLTLSYVLWKNNIKPNDIAIENIRLLPDEIALYFGKHK